MELQVLPTVVVVEHKVLAGLAEPRAGGLISMELPERRFRAETVTTKVVVVVVAGLAVVVVRTRQVPRYLGVGVVVAVRVMLHSSRMVRRPLGAALHRVGRSTLLRVRMACHQGRLWPIVVALVTRIFRTESRSRRPVHQPLRTMNTTSPHRGRLQIQRVGLLSAQRKHLRPSRGTCAR